MEFQNIIAGEIVVFSNKISKEELIKLAKNLNSEINFYKLYVKKSGRDANSLGFFVEYDGTPEGVGKFKDKLHKYIESYKKGSIKSWDINGNVTMLKDNSIVPGELD